MLFLLACSVSVAGTGQAMGRVRAGLYKPCVLYLLHKACSASWWPPKALHTSVGPASCAFVSEHRGAYTYSPVPCALCCAGAAFRRHRCSVAGLQALHAP